MQPNILSRRRSSTLQVLQGSTQLPTAYARRHRPDYWLLSFSVMLLAIGLVVIFSISPALSAVSHVSSSYYVGKQLLAILLGLVAFIAAARIALYKWKQFTIPLLGLAVIATLLAVAMPVNPNYPAHRWVRLGGFSFQSVELLKFALLVWLAGLLASRIADKTIKNVQRTIKPVLIAVLIIGVIVAGIQSDLGSMGVIIVIIGSMLFIAGMPIKKLAIICGIVTIGVILSVSAIPYRRERLFAYLHPSSNCLSTSSNYQACQALIAVGSGGMIGLGLGNSVQAYGYLPEAANDSIFAIYAEKFGFIGAVLLLGLFVGLFARIKHIAERAPDNFSRLLVIGVLSWLSVQTLINIGAMIGVVPLKGITLPLVSYGGTSVIFSLAAIGLVFQVSYYTSYASTVTQRQRKSRGIENDRSVDRRRFGGAYHPDLSSR